jgi:TrmH family RNA methyltransferase
MQNKITSASNPRIKDIVRLKEGSERKKKGLILVEGHREIRLALENGFELVETYICRDFLKKETQKKVQRELILKNKPIYELDPNVYDKISYGERQEGLLCIFKFKQTEFNDLNIKNNALFVVLEEVEKPGNLGAILRSADAAGASGIIVCDQKTEIYNPNAIRASIGTIFTVPIVISSKDEALKFLKSNGIQVLAATPEGAIHYVKTDLKKPLAFVVGSEQNGLSEFWLKNADIKIKIPMKGQADSLNVSVSTAILLYECQRQRGF